MATTGINTAAAAAAAAQHSRASTMSPNAMAFLTETAVEIADPLSLARVRGEYEKMQDVVTQLGTRVSGVLAKQENEFLGK
jgi:threonine synthase